MKKLAQIKRKNLIQRILIPACMAVIFCCLLVGIIFRYEKRENKMTASAESSIAYFTPGASIGKTVGNADKIRFRLNLNDFANTASIKINVSPFESCSFYNEDSFFLSTSSDGEAWINLDSHLGTTEFGEASYVIMLSVNPQIEYTVRATVTMNNGVTQEYTSDTRSILSVLKKMKEVGASEYEEAAVFHKEYMDSVINSSVSNNQFNIVNNSMLLDSDGTVKMTVSLTNDIKTLLASGTVTNDEKTEITNSNYSQVDSFAKQHNFYERYSRYELLGIKTNLPYWRRYLRETQFVHYELWVIADQNSSYYGATGLYDGNWTKLHQSNASERAKQGVYFRQLEMDRLDISSYNTVVLQIDPSLLGNGNLNYYVALMKVSWNWSSIQEYNVKWFKKNTLNREDVILEEPEVQAVAFSNQFITKSRKTWASEILSTGSLSDYSDEQLKGYQTLAETYTGKKEIPVTVKYKSLQGDGEYVADSTSVFNVNSLYAQNMNSVVNTLFALGTFKQLSDFNVVRKNAYFDKDNLERRTGDRIIRQATGYKYEYDSTNQKGTLTIEYSDFHYKDVMITLQSNDAESHLTKDFYTANATQANGKITLVFKYDDLEMWGKNNCGWLFGLQERNFTITDNSGGKVLIANNGSARTLTLMCSEEDENALGEVSLRAVSEIVEDVTYTMTYKYKIIQDEAGELTESTITSSPAEIMYSELLAMSYGNFMTEYGNGVTADLLPATLAGTNYCTVTNYQKAYDTENLTCEITLVYKYRPVFKVTDNRDSNWYKFLKTSDTSLLYTGDYFYDHGYDGYRVESLSTTMSDTKARIKPGYNYSDMQFELLSSPEENEVISVCLNFTDEWLIEINYMRQYKETPFAEKTKYSGKIRVKDYPDIYALTSGDLAAILGLKSMSIIRDRSTVDEITVNYDGIGTYTVNTTYTPLSMVQRDSSGKQQNEVCVPLSCYKEWCEDYGKDWTILYLNYAGKVYFRYSNEVKPENLYGFFSVAIFDNKVSDLNDVFSSFDSTGCKTFHSEEEVRGSRIYKFFRSDEGTLATVLSFSTAGLISGKLFKCSVVGIALRRIALAFCESPLSDSDNAVYTSRFFFLDGTSDMPIMAENGSTDPGNTNGAAGNTALDVIDSVKDWFSNLKDSVFNSTYAKIIAVGFGIVLVVLIFVLIVRLIRFAFSGSGRKRRR